MNLSVAFAASLLAVPAAGQPALRRTTAVRGTNIAAQDQDCYTRMGDGLCGDEHGHGYPALIFTNVDDLDACKTQCRDPAVRRWTYAPLVGLEYKASAKECFCRVQYNFSDFSCTDGLPDRDSPASRCWRPNWRDNPTGPVMKIRSGYTGFECYKYEGPCLEGPCDSKVTALQAKIAILEEQIAVLKAAAVVE